MPAPVRRLTAVLLPLVLMVAGATGAAAEDGLQLTATSARIAAGGTVVTLAGTYRCGPFPSGQPDRGVIDLTVSQARPQGQANAFGFLEPSTCDGTAQPFRVPLQDSGNGIRFRPGQATWAASGFVEGPGGVQSVFVPPSPIRLRR